MSRIGPNELLRNENMAEDAAPREARVGAAYGIAAYLWWGVCAIYYKAVAGVPPLQVLGHRVVWSVILLTLLVVAGRRWPDVRAVFRNRRTLLRLCVTTALIANNWGIFIWSVANGELLQASLGYFINPLINVLLGCVFLRERLRRGQAVSVALAGVGVAYMVFKYGEVPWIALILAFSFAFYGLIRKTTHTDALVGLTIETSLMAPIALAYLVYQATQGQGAFGTMSRQIDVLLVSAGVITAVPLLWFAAAAKRLRYSTLGFIQYIAPTGQLLIAVFAFGETFTSDHLITFAFIWTALIIYSIDAAVRARPTPAAA